MRNKIGKILAFVVVIVTLFYGVGDYLGFWDKLFLRTNAIKCYERLASNKGYPKIIIFDNEPEFSGLYEFLSDHIEKLEENERLISMGHKVTAIVRFGGTMGHHLEKQMSPDWPDVRFVPDTSPIVYMFDYKYEGSKTTTVRVCSLGDLKRWVESDRNSERFWVTTFVVGILSIAVLIFEPSKNI